jgi:hypothetical protein
LITLTTTERPATDLGQLPHKHPDRAESFLWRVHECVLAVLALESEPVDPRL